MSGGAARSLLEEIIRGLKSRPVGPNIKQAAEAAADPARGLADELEPNIPQPRKPREKAEPKSKEMVEFDDAQPREGVLVEDLPPPKPKPPEPDEPHWTARPVEPASVDDAAEAVESVGKPRPDPEDQFTNTNYDRWDTAEEMESFWETTGRQIDETHGGAGPRMTHEQMLARAAAAGAKKDPLGWLFKAVETGEVNIDDLAGNIMVARDSAVELGEKIFVQARRIQRDVNMGEEINAETLFEFQQNLTRFRSVQEGVAKVTRIAGQLLNSFKYVASNKGAVRRSQIADMIDEVGGRESILQKAQNISSLKSLDELSNEVTHTFWMRLGQGVETFRYNNMLSGFATSLRNIVGNTWFNAFRFTHAGLGSAVGSARQVARRAAGKAPNPEAVVVGDYVYGMRAALHSWMESLGLARKAWADPSIEIGGRGKLDHRQRFDVRSTKVARKLEEQFGILGRGMTEMVDILGFSLGARNLISGDIYFKNTLWRYETHLFANRVARLEGLTGKAYDTRVHEILTAPKLPKNMFEEGMQGAAVGTHTQTPEIGTFARNFLNLRNSKGALGYGMRLAVPFARVLVNIMTWSAKTAVLPMHPAFSPALRKAIKQGTREGDEYLGRLALYTTLFGTVAYQTSQNNITGTGRYVDRETLRMWKEGGWQPMSFRFRQKDGSYKYVSFAQIQPVGTLIGWMADMTDVINYYGTPDADGSDLIEGAATSLKVLVAGPLEAPFAKGLYEWLSMMFEEKGASKAVKNVGRQFLGPPNWTRDVENVMNPQRSETYGVGVLDELANNFQAGIPYWSDEMPPRLNIWGEIAAPATVPWSIMPVTESQNDDIFIHLAENGISIKPPPKVVNVDGKRINLMEQEHRKGEGWAYNDYKRILGKMRLKHLKQEMRRGAFYKAATGPDGSTTGRRDSRARLINQALADARREANEMFAKLHPASEFKKAWDGRRIKQQKARPEPLHAGMRERKKEKQAKRGNF